MNAAMMRANWNWPPGAPGTDCAQASEMRFIGRSRIRKRAALCHSIGAAPRGKKIPHTGVKFAPGDGGAQRAHEAQVEVQVVDGVEPRAENLVTAVEVPQVGAAEVAAGIAAAGRIDGLEVVLVGAVPYVHDPGRSKQVAVAGVPGRHDTVTHIDPAYHRGHDVLRAADAH